jgi:hypothetical protein
MPRFLVCDDVIPSGGRAFLDLNSQSSLRPASRQVAPTVLFRTYWGEANGHEAPVDAA